MRWLDGRVCLREKRHCTTNDQGQMRLPASTRLHTQESTTRNEAAAAVNELAYRSCPCA